MSTIKYKKITKAFNYKKIIKKQKLIKRNMNKDIINVPEYILYDSNRIGDTKHFSPVIRQWDNSVYSFNKNNNDISSLTKYNILSRIIKSYFNLSNNKKLARSKRMRYLRRKRISNKVYLSKPEIKQSNDKITINIYYFDKLKNRLSRKLFFYNRPKILKFLLGKKYRKRKLLNKTQFLERRISCSGIKQIRELKLFRDRNKFKNKYILQIIWLNLIKYILSLMNIEVYIPKFISLEYPKIKKSKVLNERIKLINELAQFKINKIVDNNPKLLFWININNFSLEIIKTKDINLTYLINKFSYELNVMIKNTKPNKIMLFNFISEINIKLWFIIKTYILRNVLSDNIILKMFNYLSLKLQNKFAKLMFKKRYKKISKLTYFSMQNIIKFKKLIPALKSIIDKLYNKKVELNLIDLKYFYFSSEIFTQSLITKMRKKLNPKLIINKSVRTIKPFLKNSLKKRKILNTMEQLNYHNNLSLSNFSLNALPFSKLELDNVNKTENQGNQSWLQVILDRLYPYNVIHDYNSNKESKIKKILKTIKYKKILGIRIEAKGRLTRRIKAARAIGHLVYKGNLKENEKYYDKQLDRIVYKPAALLRNDMRANTKYTSKASVRRIGAFGIKTWISGK